VHVVSLVVMVVLGTKSLSFRVFQRHIQCAYISACFLCRGISLFAHRDEGYPSGFFMRSEISGGQVFHAPPLTPFTHPAAKCARACFGKAAAWVSSLVSKARSHRGGSGEPEGVRQAQAWLLIAEFRLISSPTPLKLLRRASHAPAWIGVWPLDLTSVVQVLILSST